MQLLFPPAIRELGQACAGLGLWCAVELPIANHQISVYYNPEPGPTIDWRITSALFGAFSCECHEPGCAASTIRFPVDVRASEVLAPVGPGKPLASSWYGNSETMGYMNIMHFPITGYWSDITYSKYGVELGRKGSQ